MTKKDNLDIVSSIWILASNDENCFITYNSLKHRLGLDDNFNVEKLIKLHGELFRLKAPKNAIENWKTQMLNGKHLPSWIKIIEDEGLKKETINSITENDIFRSQFRAKINSKPSDIQVINWGLEHIDRIRKNSLEEKEGKYKKFSSFWIPILSTFISLVAVLSSVLIQKSIIKNQGDIKKTELEYKTKQDGYTYIMKNMTTAYVSTNQNNRQELINSLDNIETSIYNIENLISKENSKKVWINYHKFSHLCFQNFHSKLNDTVLADSCIIYKAEMKTQLQNSLFEKN